MMYEDIFLPQDTQLLTLKGVKKIEDITHKDALIAVDRYGAIAYAKPIIEKPEKFGLMCNVKTSHFDFSVGADKQMFINGDFDTKLSAIDICETLIGYDIKVTSGVCYSDSTLVRYPDWMVVVYALSMLNRTSYVGDDIKVIVNTKAKERYIENYLKQSNVKYSSQVLSKKRKAFFIRYYGKIKRVLSQDFVHMCSTRQAKIFIETCMRFDIIPNKTKCDRGYIFLCKPQNISLMTALCLKAGYRVYVDNVYKLSSYRYDSIIVAPQSPWETKVISHTISQNKTNDAHVILPKEYVGLIAVYNSCVVVIPNDMYLNLSKDEC